MFVVGAEGVLTEEEMFTTLKVRPSGRLRNTIFFLFLYSLAELIVWSGTVKSRYLRNTIFFLLLY